MEKNNYSQQNKNYKDNDINLIYFLNRLIRNKNLIGFFTLFAIIISSISYIFTKKTWQGQFQIVLANEKKPNVINSKRASSLLLGDNTQLKTEVGILKSPSILMPIFEYVKSELIKKYPKDDEITFSAWKNLLKIKLLKGTSILDITYQDKNRELIIPVLNMMSKEFQNYSGRKKARRIELTKYYLIDQIKIYKAKSAESIKKAQNFAISQDLLIDDNSNNDFYSQNLLDSNSRTNNIPFENFRLRNTTIESLRIRAANRIRNLDEQIKKIDELNDDPEQLQYIGSTIPALQKEGLISNLENLETSISELRTKYQQKDRIIQSLLVKRENLIKLLKKRSIGYLKAQKISAEAYMKSVIRPEGVILEYKELMREAGRDESTLEALENQLRKLLLEEAKSEDPWKLITNPSILDMPVAPKLIFFIFFATNIGLFLGIAASIFIEKNNGIIFEKEILNEYFPNTLIVNLNLEDFSESNDNEYFREIVRNQNRIIFNSSFQFKSKEIESIKSIMLKESNKKSVKEKFVFSRELTKKENIDDFRFLVVDINRTTYSDLNFILKMIKLNDLEINGILHI